MPQDLLQTPRVPAFFYRRDGLLVAFVRPMPPGLPRVPMKQLMRACGPHCPAIRTDGACGATQQPSGYVPT